MVIIGNVFGTSAFAAETFSEGDYTYEVLSDGTARITKYSGTESQLTIPAALAGVNVSEIGNAAFENNDDIVTVTISEGIKTIGEFAFSNCDLLENINFASSVTKINRNAFNRCLALQSVEIPSTVKVIEERVFNNCPILTEVKLNEGLEKMGNRFLAGTPVSEIYIPSTVTSANESFAELDLLETVTFAEGITSIPNDMSIDHSRHRYKTRKRLSVSDGCIRVDRYP